MVSSSFSLQYALSFPLFINNFFSTFNKKKFHLPKIEAIESEMVRGKPDFALTAHIRSFRFATSSATLTLPLCFTIHFLLESASKKRCEETETFQASLSRYFFKYKYVGNFIVNMHTVKKLASKVVPTLRGLQYLS